MSRTMVSFQCDVDILKEIDGLVTLSKNRSDLIREALADFVTGDKSTGKLLQEILKRLNQMEVGNV